jgi:hypothetical protein
MMDREFNLFSIFISYAFKNRKISFILSLYEILPLMLIASDFTSDKTNYLNFILKYVSLPYHLELINSKFPNQCPWGNLNFNKNKEQAVENFPEINSINLQNLNNLGLEWNFCKIHDTINLVFIALTCILVFLIFWISDLKAFKSKTNNIKLFVSKVLINFIYLNTRFFSQFLYLTFFNSIVYFLKYNTTNYYSSSQVFFILSLISIVLLTLLRIYSIKTFRFVSNEFNTDPQGVYYDYMLLILKIVASLEITLKKYFVNRQFLFVSIIFQLVLIFLAIREMFYSKYSINLKINYMRMFFVFSCFLMIVYNFLSEIFENYNNENYLFGHLVMISCSGLLVYMKYEDHLKLDFLTDTSKFLFEQRFEGFVRKSLLYVLNYIKRKEMMKNKTNLSNFEKEIMRENLNYMNTHYFKCRIDFSDKLCPICKTHKKYILKKLEVDEDISKNLLNDFIIIKAIFKFVIYIEKELLNTYPYSDFKFEVGSDSLGPTEFLKGFDVTQFFFLKYYLLTVMDVNLNRRILLCSITSSRYVNHKYINFSSNYLKICLKSENPDVFKEIKKLQVEENLRENLNSILGILKNFLHDVLIKELLYTDLLGPYLEFGQYHKKVVKDLEITSKSIKLENKLNFIMMSSAYKEIFNSNYDKYLSQIYDVNENIRLIETRYIRDNLIIMDLLLDSKELLIKKVPTSVNMQSIFSHEDVNTDLENFFPAKIRNQEKNKFVDAFIKNKTNFFRLTTYLCDKDNYICRVNFKLKIFLTIRNTFKIYAHLDVEKIPNLFLIERNGKILYVSKDFYENFWVSPKILQICRNVNLFKFFQELKEIYPAELISDFVDKKNFILGINMRSYRENFANSFKNEEYFIPEIMHPKLNMKTIDNENMSFLEGGEGICFIKQVENKQVLFKQLEKIKLNSEKGILIAFTITDRVEKFGLKTSIQDEIDKSTKNEKSHLEKNRVSKSLRKNRTITELEEKEFDDIVTLQEDSFENSQKYDLENKWDNEPSATESVMTYSSKGSVSRFQPKDEFHDCQILSKDKKILKTYSENSKNMTNFCLYILIINILILIVGVAFLLLVESELNFISVIFGDFQNFMKEGWGVYMNILGVTTFLTIKDSNSSFSSHNFYLEKMKPDYDPTFKIDMSKYIREDLQIGINSLTVSSKNTNLLLSTIFSDSIKQSDINVETEFFSFSPFEPGYIILKDRYFNIIQTFNNLIYSISMDNQTYFGVDILNIANNSTYLNKTNSVFLTEEGTKNSIYKNILSLIINYYKNIQAKINIVKDFMNDYEYNFFHSLRTKLYIGLGILFILNSTIIYLTYTLLSTYENHVKLVMSIIYSIDKNYIYDILHKMKLINNYINGIMNPLKVYENLKNLESKFNNTKKLQIFNSAKSPKQKFINNQNYSDESNLQVERNRKSHISHIKDQYKIISKFYKYVLLLASIILIYFTFALIIFSHKIERMNLRVELTKKMINSLKFPLDEFIVLKFSLMMNKTNIEEDYFDQKIKLDTFIKRSEVFSVDTERLKTILKIYKKTMPILTKFYEETSGLNFCPYIAKINSNLFDGRNQNFPKDKVSQTISNICQGYFFFKTDLFSVMHDIKMIIRDVYLTFINGPKDVKTLKTLYDSKIMHDINIQLSVLLKNLLNYLIDDVLTPAFNNDLSAMLIDCIIILMVNIFMSIFFLFFTQRYIFKETIENVENLNILVKVL